MKRSQSSFRALSLLLCAHAGIAAADVLDVPCTVETYRSTFAPRPELFPIQVDMDTRMVVTYYGAIPLKETRRELRGVARVDAGWQAHFSIDRNTGRISAGVDKIENGKYRYAELTGTCILPVELQGTKYRPAAGP